jgi:hypothetical protein
MLEFIFWFLLIYLFLRFFAKYILPYIVKYFLKRLHQNIYGQHTKANENRKEGETNIEYVPGKKSKNKTNDAGIGEYIEFEEVEKE